jgi:hypothetical protein
MIQRRVPEPWVRSKKLKRTVVDFGTIVVYPDTPQLNGYYGLLEKVMRSCGSERCAGRRLVAWAMEAGFKREHVQAGASLELSSSPEERRFTGGNYADRTAYSDGGRKAVELGFATREELESVAEAWRKWIETEDGFLLLAHVEVICRRREQL